MHQSMPGHPGFAGWSCHCRPKRSFGPQALERQGGARLNLSAALPGTWLLQARIDVTHDGEQHPDPLLGQHPIALLIYDRTGHFSAQFMKRDRSAPIQTAAPTAKNNTRAEGGYDAYFGTCSVDDAKGTVTQQLIGSLSPSNVGMLLTRAMEVRGDTLSIRLETHAADGTPVVRTLTWERLKNKALTVLSGGTS